MMVSMATPLTSENLKAGLPVAWNGGDADYVSADLCIGHPGRITDESVDQNLCEVGVDLFVKWHLRPSESQVAWQFSDVEVITEPDYRERVGRLDAGLPPLP
jgi:hypothetical protein